MLTILWTVLTVTYPLVVYVGLRAWPPHVLALVLLTLLGGMIGLRRLASRGVSGSTEGVAGPAGGGALRWSLLAAALLVLAAVLRQGAFIKAVPVLVSGSLLLVFGWSLRGEQSFVERLARRQEPELSPAKVRYCRRVTVVWCCFFVLNIAITLGLAVSAPLSWWTLYTGVIAYALIGGLFAVEYVVRKAMFRDYGTWWHDRLLARVLPPRTGGSDAQRER
ncbi:COG4648 family protein [Paraliomyxa miuraensis]|uniref:COG4648 family protein n=1 Tax=Paraliomyxa miuraensis TaxID=376150 RepID=UPI00224DDC2F|nr:hypothetical protein [Paraliomyxa miuraensis]MCX4247048.1 hypothetical protein [Paraliomyxa miuraensis]